MSTTDPRFRAKRLIDNLRSDVGDSEFGYRVQALFAHILLRLGAVITEINQKGHPDIRASLGGKCLLVQVKTVSHSNAPYSIPVNPSDVEGIRPRSPDDVGYYAILDCANPPSWILIDHRDLLRHSSRLVNLEIIRACAQYQISSECSEEFAEMIVANEQRLGRLNYRTLRSRALSGDRL